MRGGVLIAGSLPDAFGSRIRAAAIVPPTRLSRRNHRPVRPCDEWPDGRDRETRYGYFDSVLQVFPEEPR